MAFSHADSCAFSYALLRDLSYDESWLLAYAESYAFSNDELRVLSKAESLDELCALSIDASSEAVSEASNSPLLERVWLPKVCDCEALPAALASSEAVTEALEVELWLLLAVPLTFELCEPLAFMLLEPLELLLFEPLAVMLLEPLELLLLEPLALLLCEPDAL